MTALEDPGGFLRQVSLGPSGGQEITGNREIKEAVPERASVPPAHPTISNGSAEVL